MITTDDDAVADQARLLRAHGMRKRYYHEMLGYNFRMTDVHAAIGVAQLPKLPAFTERRIANAAYLSAHLPADKMTPPPVRPGSKHVFHQYTVRVQPPLDRDAVRAALAEAGVGSEIYYPVPVHRQDVYVARGYGDQRFPVTEEATRQVLSLPVHPAAQSGGPGDHRRGRGPAVAPVKVLTVVGARPQFIKAAPLSRALRALPGVTKSLVHTGQHYDAAMSDVFFRELDLPPPDLNLGVGSGPHGAQTGAMLDGARSGAAARAGPTAWSSMATRTRRWPARWRPPSCSFPVAHVEAGLRSYNRAMPEEINRVVADHCRRCCSAPRRSPRPTWRAKASRSGVHVVGDVMYDAVLQAARARARGGAGRCSTAGRGAGRLRAGDRASRGEHRRSGPPARHRRRAEQPGRAGRVPGPPAHARRRCAAQGLAARGRTCRPCRRSATWTWWPWKSTRD